VRVLRNRAPARRSTVLGLLIRSPGDNLVLIW
jgi:hypothetical protein